MRVSVIIPTYNRATQVVTAIISAFDMFRSTHVECEVVVVDDASADNTIAGLRARFAEDIEARRLRLVRNEHNIGVSGSKNRGYENATGEWVLFLDSDDTLIAECGPSLVAALRENSGRPVIFFRCRDQSGKLIGTVFGSEIELDLRRYIEHTSYGEALTAVNKRIVRGPPYEAALRGCEGLGCCRIIARHGAAVLSTVVARRYDLRGTDRLSVSAGLFQRLRLIARAHRIMVSEFGPYMKWRKKWGYRVKAVVYDLLGVGYLVTQRVRKWW